MNYGGGGLMSPARQASHHSSLILIHLFLLRVIRAIWVGIKPTRDIRSRVNPFIKGHRPANVLIVRTPETLSGQRHELTEEITIGRAATCEVTIDDSYASQIHARFFDGQ